MNLHPPTDAPRTPGDLFVDRDAAALPHDRIGLVPLAPGGRRVWWTGRVAIGLRYEPPAAGHPHAPGNGAPAPTDAAEPMRP